MVAAVYRSPLCSSLTTLLFASTDASGMCKLAAVRSLAVLSNELSVMRLIVPIHNARARSAAIHYQSVGLVK